ncbi:MAG: hypothetical protein FWF27_06935 [Candidatus Bathyarchaeota archaeon]|nr:hypothetical protein [Candidatus Termiticorpusculum sp.]
MKHLKNNPEQTIPPKRRERPKTKYDPDPAIPKPDRRRSDVTRKELRSQAKDYNLKVYTRWTKQQLISVLSKVKKQFFKKQYLQQLNKHQLGDKVNLRKKKDEITEAILKTQDSTFREIAASELNFHTDLIEPTKEERKPAVGYYIPGPFIGRFLSSRVFSSVG